MQQLLRYVCFAVVFLPALTGCKASEHLMFAAHPAAMSTRLPPLQVMVDNGPLDSSEGGALLSDLYRVFEQETTQNLTEASDSTRFGYARLVVTQAQRERSGRGWQALQMMTLLAPALLGLPLEYYHTHLRARVQIVNTRGEVLGTYWGTGLSTVRVAMYNGFSQKQAPLLADTEALRQALDQVRPQIALDAYRLRKGLSGEEALQASVHTERH